MALAYNPPSANRATEADQTPQELEGVGVTEKLSQKISLSLEFTEHTGQVVPLQKYFSGHKPVLFTMVYYGCPSLCNMHLNGLLKVFRESGMMPGKDYEFVAVSMNHRETPELAAKKRDNYLKELNMPGAENGWHFLVGNEANVKQLADELGFKFKWIEASQQYSHAAVAYILTPNGVISRYLYGIEFPAKTLRLSLVEAADGKIGTFIDQVTLFCFQLTDKGYSLRAFRLMQVGALLTVILLGIFLVPNWIRSRRISLEAKGE